MIDRLLCQSSFYLTYEEIELAIAVSILFYFFPYQLWYHSCFIIDGAMAISLFVGLVLIFSTIARQNCSTNVRIAFIFAGSPRSVVLPVVHNSIRENLIAAFCPVALCKADVFVRLSLTDNRHEGTGASSLGVHVTIDPNLVLKQSHKALGELTKLPNVAMFFNQIDIGSNEEKLEMYETTRENFKQRIYQDLDPRRYSMYFNRWKAYTMMVEKEQEARQPYTWVVHARLDQIWWTPIPRWDYWSMAKIWIPDFSFAHLSDTFALLPRNTSDMFFEIDYQFRPDEVMCLGGPNFNPNSSTPAALRERGYDHFQIEQVQSELCLNKFINESTGHNPRQNVTWSHAGMSESYMRRRFEFYGFRPNSSTLGFSTFFMATARNPIRFGCYDLNFHVGYNNTDWVPEHQHANAAFTVACVSLQAEISATIKTPEGLDCIHFADMDEKSQRTSLLPTCPTDSRLTNWNFLPFRVRPGGRFRSLYFIGNDSLPAVVEHRNNSSVVDIDFRSALNSETGSDDLGDNACLTAVEHRVRPGRASSALSLARCVDSYWGEHIMVDYSRLQLFSLHPRSRFRQRISAFWNYSLPLQCLTVSSNLFMVDATGSKRPLAVMSSCRSDSLRNGQSFRIQLLHTEGEKSGSQLSRRQLRHGSASLEHHLSAQTTKTPDELAAQPNMGPQIVRTHTASNPRLHRMDSTSDSTRKSKPPRHRERIRKRREKKDNVREGTESRVSTIKHGERMAHADIVVEKGRKGSTSSDMKTSGFKSKSAPFKASGAASSVRVERHVALIRRVGGTGAQCLTKSRPEGTVNNIKLDRDKDRNRGTDGGELFYISDCYEPQPLEGSALGHDQQLLTVRQECVFVLERSVNTAPTS